MNEVYNADWMTNGLPDKSVQLIIADPPYFEVKGEFDFIWKSFDDYLQDVEKWAKECKRILADNGTLFWWGHAKKIAYSQVILDKYFNLENSLVWEKKECQTMKCSPDEMRTFAPVTERLLMYSNEVLMTGLEVIKLDVNNFKTLRDYFQKVHEFIGLGKNKIIEAIGQKADHCFRYNSTQFELPTPETYQQLIDVLAINKMQYYREYEDLRREYEDLRRPFDNRGILQTDVLKYSQEAHITKNYEHDTKKPETLTRQLILTCSRPNDLVFIPFAGSGTECAMAAKEGRNFIGYDIDPKHAATAQKRVKKILSQPKLF